MDPQGPQPTLFQKIWRVILGRKRNPEDPGLFHQLALIAFFAWVGLGADGLSSLCYGPEEAYITLDRREVPAHVVPGHDGGGLVDSTPEPGETVASEKPDAPHRTYFRLGIFVALASVITVYVISAGYSRLIEAFPSGGGGYVVASKMLSPWAGMVCGCALLVDYVLTITISIASSADFIFSFIPPDYHPAKLWVAICLVLFLMLLNLRGVKESVVPLVPVFLLFVLTHGFAVVYAVVLHMGDLPQVAVETGQDIKHAVQAPSLGLFGMIVLMLKSYSTGAGTYTGIEAVSNGLQILREPRVQTGKRTMRYMAASLAIGVMGLMLAYLLFHLDPHDMYEKGQKVRTLNALLFNQVTSGWPSWLGTSFIFAALASSAFILWIAAQAGFLGGPRVAANMALDSWLPKRFATLSDRFVSHNGVLLMGGTALVTLILTRGQVHLLVVLYSINVFITFVLSQAGMVRYWWHRRRVGDETWRGGMWINGAGFVLCAFILVTLVILKFDAGGWVTLVVTGVLVLLVIGVKRHYKNTGALLRRLDGLVRVAQPTPAQAAAASGGGEPPSEPKFDPSGKTAVVLVNGFTGVGLHTLFSIVRLFSGVFKNFVFIQIGAIDADVFKGAEDIQKLKEQVADEVQKYVEFMKANGFYAEAVSSIAVDIVDEAASNLAPKVLEKFPQSVFFGGQLVFPNDSWLIRVLHNYTVFALQRKFYLRGIPFVILPIRV